MSVPYKLRSSIGRETYDKKENIEPIVGAGTYSGPGFESKSDDKMHEGAGNHTEIPRHLEIVQINNKPTAKASSLIRFGFCLRPHVSRHGHHQGVNGDVGYDDGGVDAASRIGLIGIPLVLCVARVSVQASAYLRQPLLKKQCLESECSWYYHPASDCRERQRPIDVFCARLSTEPQTQMLGNKTVVHGRLPLMFGKQHR